MGDFGIAGLWLLLAVSLVVAVLVGVGSMWLADRTLPKPTSDGHNGALSPFLTCVGLVYGALLGFTIVVAWEQFSSAEVNVSNEASTLTTMYRQTVGMPIPEQTQMRRTAPELHESGRRPRMGKRDTRRWWHRERARCAQRDVQGAR